MSEFDRKLGERLRRYRILRGMTQQALGEAVGVSFQQVQKYENGINRVSAEMLVTIAGVLAIEPMQLLTDETDGQQPAVPLGRFDMALFAALARCNDHQRHAIRQMVEAFAAGASAGSKAA